MPSPQVTVSDNGGAPVDPVASGTGVDVVAGHTIVIQLQNLAADDWSCNLIGQDDQVVAPAFTLDHVGKKVTFTAPAAPFALIFESVVNEGLDVNKNPSDAYRQRFGIFARINGCRVLAANERGESDALYGWTVDFNAAVRVVAAPHHTWVDTLLDGDATLTLTDTSNCLVDCSGFTADRTMKMPAAPRLNQCVTLKFTDASLGSHHAIIDGNGLQVQGGTSDAASTYTMDSATWGAKYASLTLCFNGTLWETIGAVVGAAPSWTPTSIANLGAWYRGDHVTLDGSSNVQTAIDQGPSHYDATQASAGNRPSYNANGGLGYWTSAVATSLVATATAHAQPFEVWAVVRPTSATPGAGGYVFDSAGGNQTVLAQLATTGTVQVYAGSSFTDAQITVADHIVSGLFNGASSDAALDGAVGTTGNCGAQTLGATWTLGNQGAGGLANGFVGRIYEVIVVLGALSGPDRTSLVAYLKARYSIP